MEVEMSDTGGNPPDLYGENDPKESNRESSRDSWDASGSIRKSADPEGLLAEIERFSRLSSELRDCLLCIIRKTKDAMEAFSGVEQAVKRKENELKQLHDIESSAAALERMAEQHRIQKEEFESFMEGQRRLWDEEKSLRDKEDAEYRENLERRRQRDLEDYRRKLAEEKSAVRKEMEEQFDALQRESLQRRKEIESRFEQRERALREKEQECTRLVRELELFMTGLEHKARNAGDTFPKMSEGAQAGAERDMLLAKDRSIDGVRTGRAEWRGPLPEKHP
jgi:hypothetical protein